MKKRKKLNKVAWLGVAIFALLPFFLIIISGVWNDYLVGPSEGFYNVLIICWTAIAFGILGLFSWKYWLRYQRYRLQQIAEVEARTVFLAHFDQALIRSLPTAKPPDPTDKERLRDNLKKLIALAKEELQQAKTDEGIRAAEQRLTGLIDQMETLLLNI